ncbi:hypothetical protein J6590_016308 [Homalodisca vitripennis]|nr:hypothetical protein J6590_016308 [Homalodisca vitripennis]
MDLSFWAKSGMERHQSVRVIMIDDRGPFHRSFSGTCSVKLKSRVSQWSSAERPKYKPRGVGGVSHCHRDCECMYAGGLNGNKLKRRPTLLGQLTPAL